MEKFEKLGRYNIHHNRAVPVFDQLVAMTASLLDMPVALINFVDEDKVWRNSMNELQISFGMDVALCAMALDHENLNLIQRLAGKPYLMVNPVTAAESGLRFYATVPITTEAGLNVGMLCVADQNPRVFLPEEKAKLICMASLVQNEMNQRITGSFCA